MTTRPLVLSLLLCALAARADVVELKNGNVMKGTITGESGDAIELDIGVGAVTLNRADVARVRRASGRSKAAQDRELKRRRVETGEGVPEDGRELGEALKKAAEARDAAMAARDRGESEDEERKSLVADLKDLRRRYKGDMERLAALDPATNEYRAVRDDAASAAAESQAKAIDLRERLENAVSSNEDVRAYLSAYEALRRARESYLKDRAPDADDADFRTVIDEDVRRMERDFRQERVKVERRGLSLVADATIDGETHARLIVDTGASLVVLSQAVLERLGTGVKERGEVEAALADGSRVRSKAVELDSLEVGGTRARHVLAAVVPNAAPGADGLLGMSFLGRYSVQTDLKGAVLVLRSLKDAAADEETARAER